MQPSTRMLSCGAKLTAKAAAVATGAALLSLLRVALKGSPGMMTEASPCQMRVSTTSTDGLRGLLVGRVLALHAESATT